MKLDIKETSSIKRDIFIEVDKDSLRDIKNKVLDTINKQVNVPGFRKGKAPVDLIEKRFPQLVKEELFKEAIPLYYNKALDEKKLDVVGAPSVKNTEYSQDKLSFVVQVEVKPKIDIDDKAYKQIKVKVSPVEVEEKEIAKYTDQLKERIAQSLGKKKEDIDDGLVFSWSGYKDIDEFKKAVHSELHLNKVIQRRRSMEHQITESLLDKFKFELPSALVEEQKRHMMTQQFLQMRSQGISDEDIKKHSEEISNKVDSLAKDQLKLYYVMEEIAKRENLIYKENSLYEVVLGFILSQVKQ